MPLFERVPVVDNPEILDPLFREAEAAGFGNQSSHTVSRGVIPKSEVGTLDSDFGAGKKRHLQPSCGDTAPWSGASAGDCFSTIMTPMDALHGKAEALRRILDLGVDVNACSIDIYSNATPLHHAVCSGPLDVVKVLVEAGAGLGTRAKAENATSLLGRVYQGEKKGDDVKRYAEIAAYLREKEGQR